MSSQKAKYSAFDTAIYYLTFKDRTRKEIQDKLSEKGYGNNEINEAVEKLVSYGYIDDEGYALSYIKSKKGKMGSRLIRMKLIGKGISGDIIDSSLNEVSTDEFSDIKRILMTRYGDLSDISVRRRAQGYLARRGYSYDDISSAVNSLLKEENYC